MNVVRTATLPFLLTLAILCPLLGGSAAAQADDPPAQVTPAQLTIAGVTGSQQIRTLLLHLPAETTVEAAVAGDLSVTDGAAVVPAAAVQARWQVPEAPVDTTSSAPAADAAAAPPGEAQPAQPEAEAPDQAEPDQADPNPPVPIPLTVSIDLRRIAAAQYTGQLYVITSAGELPVPVSVSVKSRAFWPFIVLLAGVALGIGMTSYRKRGRPRDQLLVEAGTLRNSMDADPQLAYDGTGAVFRTSLENKLLETQVALRSGDWDEAGRQLVAANTLYVAWRKDRANWIAQLAEFAQLRAALTTLGNIPFALDLLSKLDQVVAAAPGQSDASTLRTELATLQQYKAEYDYGAELLAALNARIDQLNAKAATSNIQRERYQEPIATYTKKHQEHTRTLHGLRPIADTNYATAYASFTKAVTDDISALDTLLQPKSTTRSDENGDQEQPAFGALPQMATPHVPPLHESIGSDTAAHAQDRLRYFGVAGYGIALILLVLAGFTELYVAKTTFGANPWADYATLFAWGFGAEATRAAVTDLVKNWDITIGA